MWRVQATDGQRGWLGSSSNEFESKEEACVNLAELVFKYPNYQWRLLDPQGNVVT
jgi:hypothetical protein